MQVRIVPFFSNLINFNSLLILSFSFDWHFKYINYLIKIFLKLNILKKLIILLNLNFTFIKPMAHVLFCMQHFELFYCFTDADAGF